MTKHARRDWTVAEVWLAIFLALGCIGITVPAFVEIYRSATAVVHPWFGRFDWVVPVCAEIAWVVIFLAGVLLAVRNLASGSFRSSLQAALVAGSVLIQVWAGDGSVPSITGHVIVVVAFFGTLAVAKSTITRLIWGKVIPDKITAAEWLTHPTQSFKLWRHMAAWGETSKQAARTRYSALLYATAIAQSDRRIGSRFTWQRRLPVTLRYQLRAAAFPPAVEVAITGPGAIPGGWQEPVRAHVLNELRLLNPAPLSDATPDAIGKPSGKPAGTPPEPGLEKPSQTPAQKPLRKPTKAAVRKMSGADLAPYIEALLGTDPAPSKDKVMKFFGVGAPKAQAALDTIASPPPEAAVIALPNTAPKAPASRPARARPTRQMAARR